MIEIDNLYKTYPSGEVAALSGVSLRVEEGDIFGVIGMSGAGKSTLLRCIAQLEVPTSGRIDIGGEDISRLRGRELIEHRRQVGVVFQGYHLLMQRTVADNVAFPLELSGMRNARTRRAETRRRVEELLSLVGLSDKADAYPSCLSGGQKQRVAIARALAANPKVLLCDEPTSALDSLTTRAMLELLRDINSRLRVTIVLITHEIGVVRAVCNKLAVIDGGAIVEQGDTGAVLSSPRSPITRLLLGQSEADA